MITADNHWHHNSQTVNDDLLADTKTPIDIIMAMEEFDTSTSDYRECSLKFLTLISLAMAYIISAKDTTSAAYGGKSQREIAKEIGVSSGTISWHSVQFKKFAGIKV
jgi:hypothetical protein